MYNHFQVYQICIAMAVKEPKWHTVFSIWVSNLPLSDTLIVIIPKSTSHHGYKHTISSNFSQITAVTWVKTRKNCTDSVKSRILLKSPSVYSFNDNFAKKMIIFFLKPFLFCYKYTFPLDLMQMSPLSRTWHITYVGFCPEFFTDLSNSIGFYTYFLLVCVTFWGFFIFFTL